MLLRSSTQSSSPNTSFRPKNEKFLIVLRFEFLNGNFSSFVHEKLFVFDIEIPAKTIHANKALTRIRNKSISLASSFKMSQLIVALLLLHFHPRSLENEKNVLSDSLFNLFPCFSYKTFPQLFFSLLIQASSLRFRLNAQFIETSFARYKTFNSKLAVDYLSALISRELLSLLLRFDKKESFPGEMFLLEQMARGKAVESRGSFQSQTDRETKQLSFTCRLFELNRKAKITLNCCYQYARENIFITIKKV